MLRKVIVKIGLEKINMYEGVTIEILLDSGAIELVMSLQESRDLSWRKLKDQYMWEM